MVLAVDQFRSASTKRRAALSEHVKQTGPFRRIAAIVGVAGAVAAGVVRPLCRRRVSSNSKHDNAPGHRAVPAPEGE